jgi:hypothetical protein
MHALHFARSESRSSARRTAHEHATWPQGCGVGGPGPRAIGNGLLASAGADRWRPRVAARIERVDSSLETTRSDGRGCNALTRLAAMRAADEVVYLVHWVSACPAKRAGHCSRDHAA